MEVPENTAFLTCGYCSSRLAVRRSGNAVYTEVLEALEKRTQRIAKDVEVIKMQNQLAELDRQWMVDREKYMVRGKYGASRVPTRAGSVIFMLITVVFGLVFLGMGFSSDAPLPAMLFALLFVGAAVAAGVYRAQKAESYQRGKRNYQRRRQELLRNLRELEQETNTSAEGFPARLP